MRYETFGGFDAIPADDMRVLRNMKYAFGTFADMLWHHANSKDYATPYDIHDIVVMRDEGEILGWCIHWTFSDEPRPSLGFWVRSNRRGQGYGKALVTEAYRRWNHENPFVFNAVKEYLWDHVRASQLSPNASVTLAPVC